MRSTTVRTKKLPLELQQQIDACCDQFESILQDGQSPDVSEFLQRIPAEGQLQLRQELAAIEMAYQQRSKQVADSGGLHLRCPHCQNQVELLPDAKLEDITCNSCGDTFSLIDEDAEAGDVQLANNISHFELVRCLGTGGFGSVWEAVDTELDRRVAVKIPRKNQLSTRETEQFFREARTAAQLKHPNIVPVHEVGKEDSTIFIVTDLILGQPLSDRLEQGPLAPRETARLCAIIAEALEYAHSRGIIHRDLKPSNIMLDQDEQPHIMDFGLAKRELGEITMTLDGTVLGTPAYMSPEQALGQSHWIDRRTDIYSLGVVLFRLLTQELPYRGTAQQQIQQRVTDDAPDPRKLNAHVPADLATICLKCLERDPNKRFNGAGELAAELRRYLAGEPIKSRPISSFSRLARWAKRKPALATAAVLTLVLAIAGPLAAITLQRQNETIANQLVERNQVIARDEQEKKQLSGRLQQLQIELQRYEQAQPDRAELDDWRKRLIGEYVAAHQQQRDALLAADGQSREQLTSLIRDHLGWGYLLRGTEQFDQAKEHFSSAVKLFAQLHATTPLEATQQQLLAASWQQLSELQELTDDHEAATKSAAQAQMLRKQLASQLSDQFGAQIDAFESLQWRIEQAADGKLQDWQQSYKQLSKLLRADDLDIYELARQLTQQPLALPEAFAPVTTGKVLE